MAEQRMHEIGKRVHCETCDILAAQLAERDAMVAALRKVVEEYRDNAEAMSWDNATEHCGAEALVEAREGIAAAITFLSEVKPDDVAWRWDANTEHAKKGHCGDCTKEAHTCALCLRERSLADADWLIASVAAIRARSRAEAK